MGRLPQTTEARTREDCAGTSRDVSEKRDAVGSGGNLHPPLHLLPLIQLRGHRKAEGLKSELISPFAGIARAKVGLASSLAGAKVGLVKSLAAPKIAIARGLIGAKSNLAKGLLGAKLGLARTVLRPVAGIKRAKLSALRGLLDRKISLLDF